MCRGVYITDSVHSVSMLPDNTFRTGAYGAIDLSTFLEILNCDFAITFVIDNARRPHSISKICEWDILLTPKNGSKFRVWRYYLQNSVEFQNAPCRLHSFLGLDSAYILVAKNVGNFLLCGDKSFNRRCL